MTLELDYAALATHIELHAHWHDSLSVACIVLLDRMVGLFRLVYPDKAFSPVDSLPDSNNPLRRGCRAGKVDLRVEGVDLDRLS